MPSLIGAPLVEWLIDNASAVEALGSNAREQADELTVFWLRGVGHFEVAGRDVSAYRALRVRIRAQRLQYSLEPRDGRAWEALALLGTDSSDRSVAELRTLARDMPGFLGPVVESTDVALSLAMHDPELLVELTEAYYIVRPPQRYGHSHDGGIRNHEGFALDLAQAAWYRGPFFALLRQNFRLGVRVIDRMLAHSIQHGYRRPITSGQHSAPPGLILTAFGQVQHFHGDINVWLWYRGSSNGPYPCVSALLALEYVADELIKHCAIPAGRLAKVILGQTSTLATVGLVFGMLVRHIDTVTDELDDFLTNPDVWRFEFCRLGREGHLHIQRRDADELYGRDRRTMVMQDLAGHLVLDALHRNDTERLDTLRGIGRHLIDAAGGEQAPLEVQQWGAHLDGNCYSFHLDGDHYIFEFQPPEHLSEALASEYSRSARASEVYRLLNRYRLDAGILFRASPPDLPTEDELQRDLDSARSLQTDLDNTSTSLRPAIAGVAAAVLRCATAADRQVPAPDVQWAVSILVESAMDPYGPYAEDEDTVFPDRADRFAAYVLPLALLLDLPAAEADAVTTALQAATTSPADEARYYAAEGPNQLWLRPCIRLADGCCHHDVLWRALEAGAQSVVLSIWNDQGTRELTIVDGDPATEIPIRPTEDLWLPRIAVTSIGAIMQRAAAVPFRTMPHGYETSSCPPIHVRRRIGQLKAMSGATNSTWPWPSHY